jgi:formylglycine-generating enzyme required for sulfatase activity
VILAWAFELTREGLKPERDLKSEDSQQRAGSEILSPTIEQQSLLMVLRQPRFAVPAVLAAVLALGTIGVLTIKIIASQQTRQETIPRIIELAELDEYVRAYALAEAAEHHLPNDPVLAELWPRISVTTSIISDPDGVEVFYKRYDAPDDEWVSLGQTPIESLRLPRTVFRWRFEKEGFEAAERMVESFSGTFRVNLTPGSLPSEMVRVPTLTLGLFLLTGFNSPNIEVPQFLVDRHEVTNKQYLQFVEGGGYKNKDFWKDLVFISDNEEVSWESAIARFRDSTGRHAPSTWEGGTFPEGKEDYPVSGVSWFEAAAYARFRGKELPTIYHWRSLAVFPSSDEFELGQGENVGSGMFRGEMLTHSNFSGIGATAVGNNAGTAPFGAQDAAGNVREWTWNATSDRAGGERYILGGSWSDPSYLFTYGIAESPWDRSENNGFRLARYTDELGAVSALQQPVELPRQEKISPISDEIFQVYRDLYGYDRAALNVIVESVDTQSAHWSHETVSFDAPYGDERVIAHVFLPKNIEPPYQVVAYYPSSSAIYTSTSDDLELPKIDFIIKSGRALVIPVLRGTYE